jgi:SAM-dependent methyltransferase
MSGGRARTFSTGFDGSRLRNNWNLFRQYRRHQRDSVTASYEEYCRARDVVERHTGRNVADLSVLEIGCGQRFTLTLLLHSAGARVVGIDMDEVHPVPSPRHFVSNWRRNGVERALKTLVRQLLFDRPFYRDLAGTFGAPLRVHDVDLRVMDACALDIPDQSVDCILSSSVFEHIYDVEAATREMARVLKPGGVACINICLFPGISGGHHVDWFEPEEVRPRAVPAWNHLRQNLQPPQVFLNRLRKADYLVAFGRHLAMLDVQPRRQGEAHLTHEIARELSNFSREELLTGAITVILGKAGGGVDDTSADRAGRAATRMHTNA